MALVGAATFAFRWLSLGAFPNDHFDHVARARQVLLGEWPVRDFTDPGFLLSYLSSAAVHAVVEPLLLAETLLFASGLAVAAALTFRLALVATGSLAISLGAVALQVLAYPRPYSYPKLLVYAVAITVGWWAIERLTIRRLAALAGVTALAYYFRHDHGVYVGIGSLVLLIVHLWPHGLARISRTVALYLAMTTAAVLPHLAYVHWAIGLGTYIDVARGYNRAEMSINPYEFPWFALESIAGDVLVVLFWICWILPIVGIAAAGLQTRRDQSETHPARMAMVIALAVAANAFLRDPLAARAADAAMPHTLLGAWLFATLWRWPVPRLQCLATRSALIVFTLLVTAAIAVAFDTREKLLRTRGWRGPVGVAARWAEVGRELRRDDSTLMPGSARALVPFFRYVQRCTSPDDRILYVGYQPEMYVFAGRGFAGGHMMFYGGYHASPEEQALTLERLARSSVPLVLVPSSMREHFDEVFTPLAEYVGERYVPIAAVPGEHDSIAILAERTRTVGRSSDAATGWPCLTPSPPV